MPRALIDARRLIEVGEVGSAMSRPSIKRLIHQKDEMTPNSHPGSRSAGFHAPNRVSSCRRDVALFASVDGNGPAVAPVHYGMLSMSGGRPLCMSDAF